MCLQRFYLDMGKTLAYLYWKPWRTGPNPSLSLSLLTFTVSAPVSHLLLELVSWIFQRCCPPKSSHGTFFTVLTVVWRKLHFPRRAIWQGASELIQLSFLLIPHIPYIKSDNDLRVVKPLWRYWSTKLFINLVTHFKTGGTKPMLLSTACSQLKHQTRKNPS